MTPEERVMKTTMGLNEYCLERLAEGKDLEQALYMIGDHGRQVTLVPWSNLPDDKTEMLSAFMNLLTKNDPDLVVHFTLQRFGELANTVINMDSIDTDGRVRKGDPRLLVMSCLGKGGAFVHMQVLEEVPGVVAIGDVFQGHAHFFDIGGANRD